MPTVAVDYRRLPVPVACPDEDQLAAFALGALSGEQRVEVERHLADCEDCCRVAAMVSLSTEGTAAAREAEGLSLTREAPGRYELRRELGAGGQGRVYLAFDHHLQREVAFKVPHADQLTRFLTEARLTARLRHPNIVALHEVGRRDDGSLYAVQALAPLDPSTGRARTLRDVFSATTGAARLALVPLLLEATHALAVAHEASVVHGDFKPENVAAGVHGDVTVLDWGLASDLTQPARPRISGTPRYMSPERARGEAARTTDDVWSLGKVLAELLEGAPDVAPLRAIAARATAPEVSQRYPHAAALALDLRAWLTDGVVGAHRYALTERLSLTLRRHRRVALFASAVAVVASIGLAVALAQRSTALEHHAAALTREAEDAQRRSAWDTAAALFLEADALDPSTLRRRAADVSSSLSMLHRRVALDAPVASAAAGADGRVALGLAHGGVVVLREGSVVTRWPVSGAVLALAWVDGEVVTASDEGRIERWSAEGTQRRQLLAAPAAANAVARANTSLLVSGDDGVLRRVRDDGAVTEVRLSEHALYGLSVRARDQLVAIATWQGDVLLVTEAGELRGQWRAHSDAVLAVAWADDGERLLTGSRDGTVRLWNATGEQLGVFAEHRARVNALAWVSDTLAASGGGDDAVRFWDTHSLLTLPLAAQNVGQDVAALAVVRGGDGAVWAAGPLGVAWEVGAPPSLTPALLDEKPAWCEVTETGGWVGQRGGLSPDPRAPNSRAVRAVPTAVVTACRSLPGGDLLVLTWSPEEITAQRVQPDGGVPWRTPLALPRRLAVDVANGLVAVVTDARAVPLLSLADGGVESLETGHSAGVMDVAFGGGRLATASYDKTVRLFDARTRTFERTLEGHTQGVRAVVLSGDGGRVVSGGWDGTIRLWDATSGGQLAMARAHRGFVVRLAFSPSGQRIASAGTDGTVAVWSATSLAEELRVPSFGAQVGMLEWLDDERLVVTSGWRRRVIGPTAR
ncbi:MAG: protein kinase [Archangium sp.]|nr:protein kinase [Archangium sp.]